MLCIDCGGVLTRYGDVKHDGEEIYKATMPGAWAFLLLWQACYGEDAVRIISKVKWFPHKEKHWVVRHAMSLGLSSDQVFLTDQNSNKGYYARRSNGTVVVDDRLDCLQSMMNGCSKSLQTAVLFGGADPRNEKKVHCISDFRDLAVLLEVYPNGTVWDWLMEEGPPKKPHDEAVRDDLLQRLKALDDARAWLPTSTANKRKVEAASALSSSSKWVPKGSAAPAGDNDDDDERPPPPDNVVFLYRKSAAKKPVKKESPPPSTRPPKQSTIKEEPDYGGDQADDDDDNDQESSSEEDQEEDTESEAKKLRRSSSKKSGSRRRSTSTDAKIRDLQNQVKQLQWQQQAGWYYPYYQGAAAASAAQGSQPAAPAASAGPPLWGGRRPDSSWTQAKLKRAELHRATGGQTAQRMTPAIACCRCGKNQPGAYCPARCCRRCCTQSSCPQHHG